MSKNHQIQDKSNAGTKVTRMLPNFDDEVDAELEEVVDQIREAQTIETVEPIETTGATNPIETTEPIAEQPLEQASTLDSTETNTVMEQAPTEPVTNQSNEVNQNVKESLDHGNAPGGNSDDRPIDAGVTSGTNQPYPAGSEIENAPIDLTDDLEVADDTAEIGAALAAEDASLEADLAEIRSNIKTDEIGRVLNSKPERRWLKRTVTAVICLLVVAILGAGGFIIARKTNLWDKIAKIGQTETSVETPNVGEPKLETDYSIKPLDQDGKTLDKITYNLESSQNFTLRLPIKDVQTVELVTLGNQNLLKAVDYETEIQGKILVIKVKAAAMQRLSVGEQELTSILRQQEAEHKIGVKFQIESIKCATGQKLENNTCVDLPPETPKDNTQKPATTKPNSAAETPKPTPSTNNNTTQPNTNNPQIEQPTQVIDPIILPSTDDKKEEKSEAQLICEASRGPQGIIAIHWEGEGEEQHFVWQHVEFEGGAVMVWADNACRPSVKYSQRTLQESGVQGDLRIRELLGDRLWGISNNGQEIVLTTTQSNNFEFANTIVIANNALGYLGY